MSLAFISSENSTNKREFFLIHVLRARYQATVRLEEHCLPRCYIMSSRCDSLLGMNSVWDKECIELLPEISVIQRNQLLGHAGRTKNDLSTLDETFANAASIRLFFFFFPFEFCLYYYCFYDLFPNLTKM